MPKLIFCFVLLLTVKLYSGGVCIGEWKTDSAEMTTQAGKVYFYGNVTGQNMVIHGTYVVSDDGIKRRKRK